MTLGPVQLEFTWLHDEAQGKSDWKLTRAQKSVGDQFTRQAEFPMQVTQRNAESALRAAAAAIRSPFGVSKRTADSQKRHPAGVDLSTTDIESLSPHSRVISQQKPG